MATKNNAPVEEKTNNAPIEEKDLAAENAALKAELEAMKNQMTKDLTKPKKTGPKMVKIRIPKTKELKDDVFVSVNFRTYQIQRGVDVEVPDFVAEVLQNREKMLEEIMLFEEKVSSK